MEKPLCVILMGSSSDKEHSTVIVNELATFGIESVLRIGSAHKTPEHVIKMLKEYECLSRPKIYVTVAGRSNALSGFVDGFVTSPTIACPPKSESFGGADVFSSLRMPSGISCAVILEPKNAALFVAKTFSMYDEEIQKKVKDYMEKNAQKILLDDASL